MDDRTGSIVGNYLIEFTVHPQMKVESFSSNYLLTTVLMVNAFEVRGKLQPNPKQLKLVALA